MKRKYVPDLTKQMAVCEANYARLNKLMPDLEGCDRREFQIEWGESHQAHIRIEVEERFTYTTTLQISQNLKGASDWLDSPALVVRLYHDAAMAEVICMKRRRQLSGVYPYPNREMHQPDEKVQLNNYLGEWLSHCLNHGQMLEPVFSR
ncbi:DUF1249 domain-containing protein [Neptunomonas concharum]|uniref:DUF1249 domain-containing protein n=1 Tax=Neptunomonas concharum TaxID=1031538 RepID=A0A5P1R8N9_9GAMM|nr:DUF1249 domain-containing protein [Neptunomonas concharum]QEQ95655.1 DUF1249 domain-containing protein [Neptunomonas concharum]